MKRIIKDNRLIPEDEREKIAVKIPIYNDGEKLDRSN